MMRWMNGLRRLLRRRTGRENGALGSAVVWDPHASLREQLFADESLESVARFVLQQEAMGGQVSSDCRRLARVAAWVAREHRALAIEELYRLLEDEGHDARSCFQFWNYLRQLGEAPGPEVAARILGLVIEHSRQGRPEVVCAYWDGTARWLDGRGDFTGFTDPAPFMVDEMRRLLRVCGPLVEATGPLRHPRPPPPSGTRCRLTVLTPAGLRMREGLLEELWGDAVCGPVLEMAGELTERLMKESQSMGLWRPGMAPWPKRGGPDGGGGSTVH
ncbi:hypothetical protein HPC49_49405 [Pyxidicoccus fallax]|uniref:Uncharacterized protein n=1 Tax=Pyxidicoccus fallax TaxID=394095 RepID=A0A848LDK2_9BACT|nr:hypothetical protein [Pyxidicoccus fallax]NMO16302.1 hypothetical protein [Pyxidicoccus fallax]NPC86193.1 hypothetical protein [Pyxidicoccus fallax]